MRVLRGSCTLALQAALVCAAAAAMGAPRTPLEVSRTASPAERLRGAERLSLDPGVAFAPGDRLVTGEHGRGSLRFVNVSDITLGAQGELQVHSFDTTAAAAPVLRLRLLRGALRLDSRSPAGLPPDIRLNVGDLRLRVFGAEVWTQVSGATRTVCLLAGAVEMQSPQGPERMDLPGECLSFGPQGRVASRPDRAAFTHKLVLTAYADEISPAMAAVLHAATAAPAPPLQPPQPAGPAGASGKPPAQAAEKTAAAPLPRLATMPASGWTLVVASLADAESARLEVQGLVDQGLPALLRVHDPGGGAPQVYRVAIGSFPTREAAAAYAAQLQRSHGIGDLWFAPY